MAGIYILVFLYCMPYSTHSFNLTERVFFMHQLSVSDFVSDASHTEVRFTVSTKGLPDLPKWLRLEQDDSSEPAYLYGSPTTSSAKTLDLEITGWDKEDYSVKRKEITLHIDHSQDVLKYQAEFTIKSANLDVFLGSNQPDTFKSQVEELWKAPPRGIQVTNVESLLDRGGRVPVPPNKEGVFIAVGGEKRYTSLESDYVGCPQGLKPDAQKFFSQWVIDWCKFQLRELSSEDPKPNVSASTGAASGAPFHQTEYAPPVHHPEARDFGLLFVVVLLLPLLIVLILAILLGCVMFCFREGRAKRDQRTPRSQINHHDSILRTTFQLRQMAYDNDVTRPSTAASSHDRDRDPNPNEERPAHTSTPYARSNEPNDVDGPRGAPPPYRMPPPAGVHVSSPDGSNQYYPGSYGRPPSSQGSLSSAS